MLMHSGSCFHRTQPAEPCLASGETTFHSTVCIFLKDKINSVRADLHNERYLRDKERERESPGLELPVCYQEARRSEACGRCVQLEDLWK